MAVSTQYDHVALPGAELLDDPMDSSWPKAPAKGRPRPSARPPSGTAPHQCCPSRIAALEPARDVDLAFPSPCSELLLRSGPGFNPIHGAVVGHTALVGPHQQIAVLPFVVLDAAGPVAWEVHRSRADWHLSGADRSLA